MRGIDVGLFKAPAFSLALGRDGELRFEALNDVASRLSGLKREDLLGHTPRECLPARVAIHVETQYRHCIRMRAAYEYEQHLELPGSARWWRTMLSPVIDPSTEEVAGLFGLTMDITDRKLAELELRSAAFKDPLTGICNRRRFDRDLENAVARAIDTGRRFAVVLADVDRFKPINDTHGHAVGDAVLKEIADRLAKGIHDTDRLARIGGDEFAAILFAGSDIAIAVALDRLRRSLVGPIRAGGQDLDVGVSLGAALWRADMTTASMIAAADAAMYAEKRLRAAGCGTRRLSG